MNCPKVSRSLYFVNSWVEKVTPFEAKLQIARLKTFRVKSSSMREQFSRREVLRVLVIEYLLTSRPCLEKFSQMTARMARMSFLRVLCSRRSQSMRKTVRRNLRVKGKQNLGFSLMSSAMRESTYSIRNSRCWSWQSSYQSKGKGTSSCRPSRVNRFIIFRIRSTHVMNTDVQPFLNRILSPCRHCQSCSFSEARMQSASWAMALAASLQSATEGREERRNSKGGFSRIMGEQEVYDQVDPDELIVGSVDVGGKLLYTVQTLFFY